jgi:putative copper export protein
MAISPWDAMAVIAKAVSYAATLGAAGGVLFLTYSRSLLEASGGKRIRRWVGTLLLVSALASVAKILLTAGSMSGDLAGMVDVDLDRMILQAGEGRALGIRLFGLVLMAWAVASRRPRSIALAGACLLWLLLHDVAGAWNGPYGRFVLAKLVAVASLLAVAAYNHQRLTPRLLAADSLAIKALRMSIALEIVVALAVLIVTAAMTTLTGP